ncbi:MAG: BTAD domain-containing putative transcriptional regulator [Arachnia sp.]
MAGSHLGIAGRHLSLLPAFEFSCDGQPCALPVRAQRLLALLALAGHPLKRSVVAARLWPDVVNDRANASLRATLWGMLHGPDAPVVVLDGTLLTLAPQISLDIAQAREAATAIIDGADIDGLPERAVPLLSQDLLPDWHDDWLVLERDAFRQLRLHALEVLCIRLAESGRYAKAVMIGLETVSSDPYRESAHRALMVAHLLEGNRMEAIRVYHRYLSMAREEMGIGASPHMEALLQAALHDKPLLDNALITPP